MKLTWVTNTEIDNSGFNLYRKSKNGPLQKLNAVLIAAQQPGSSSGHTYTYNRQDREARAKPTVTIWTTCRLQAKPPGMGRWK